MTHSLLSLFPDGQIVSFVQRDDSYVYIPIESGQWLQIPKSSLNNREKRIYEALKQPLHPDAVHPWYEYVTNKKNSLPVEVQAVQFIHLSIRSLSKDQSVQECLKTIAMLLPNCLSHFQFNEQQYVLVLKQSPFMDSYSLMQDIIETLEFDFNVRLHIFVGHIWKVEQVDSLPSFFQQEAALFQRYIQHATMQKIISFSSLLLWSYAQQAAPVSLLHYIKNEIEQHEQMKEIIHALWNEQLTLSKVASTLYIHRNTLHYRIEKFFEHTYLSLKVTDDLVMCYLASHYL